MAYTRIYRLKTKYFKRICKISIYIAIVSTLITIGCFGILGYNSILLYILVGICWLILNDFTDLENKDFDENRTRYMVYVILNSIIIIIILLYVIWGEIQGILPSDLDTKWVFI